MAKEIIAVYQDCVLCGDKGKKKVYRLAKKGLNIRKVSTFTDEGDKLVNKAVLEHKMGSLPFYTDGTIFSYHVETFIEKKKVAKKSNKKSKKVEVKEDEPVSEA